MKNVFNEDIYNLFHYPLLYLKHRFREVQSVLFM